MNKGCQRWAVALGLSVLLVSVPEAQDRPLPNQEAFLKETRKHLAGLLGMQVFGSGRMTTATIAVELLPDRWRDFIGQGRGGVAGQDRQGQER